MAKTTNFLDYIKVTISDSLNNVKIDGSEKGFWINLLSIFSVGFVNFLDYTKVQPIMLKAIALSIVANIATGIWKSKRLGKSYSGKIMLGGLAEKLVYLILFFATAFMIRAFGYEYEWLITTIFAILAFSELSSAWTNLQIGKTKKEIEDVDVITLLSKFIRAFIRGIINFLFDKLKASSKELDNTDKKDN